MWHENKKRDPVDILVCQGSKEFTFVKYHITILQVSSSFINNWAAMNFKGDVESSYSFLDIEGSINISSTDYHPVRNQETKVFVHSIPHCWTSNED